MDTSAALVDRALASDEIPDGIKSIKQDTACCNNRIDGLEKRTQVLERSIELYQDEMERLKAAVSLLHENQIQSGVLQKHNTHSVRNSRSRSLRDNMVFTFNHSVVAYNEVRGENCVDITKSFLENVIGITGVNISSAHRLGKIVPGTTRSMIARIPGSSQRTKILAEASRRKAGSTE